MSMTGWIAALSLMTHDFVVAFFGIAIRNAGDF